ncbi:MAG: hypothetical protein AB1632_14005 [Nitrospirota bacterium]
MLKRILYFILVIASTSEASGSIDLRQYKTSAVLIRYEAPLENAAKKLAETYPLVRADIEEKLGWKVKFVPEVVLIRRNALFQETASGNLITAVDCQDF